MYKYVIEENVAIFLSINALESYNIFIFALIIGKCSNLQDIHVTHFITVHDWLRPNTEPIRVFKTDLRSD